MDQPRSGEGYSRSEKSLSTLTKKFVEMLQGEDILDLNIVSVTNANIIESFMLVQCDSGLQRYGREQEAKDIRHNKRP